MCSYMCWVPAREALLLMAAQSLTGLAGVGRAAALGHIISAFIMKAAATAPSAAIASSRSAPGTGSVPAPGLS